MKKLSIILSGSIFRNLRGGYLPFWTGFINLQNSLPKNIEQIYVYGHTWTKTAKELIEMTYGEGSFKFEKQEDLETNIFNKYRFEEGIDRKKTTWFNVTIQSLLGNALGRSNAIKLAKNEIKNNMACIITRWDLGCSGSKDVNTLNFDPSLDMNRIYLPYFREIDEGYPDMWIYSHFYNLVFLENFYDFTIKSLNEENDYISLFTTNWPFSNKETFIKSFFRRLSYNILQKNLFNDKNIWKIKSKYIRFLTVKIRHYLLKFETQTEIWKKKDIRNYFPIYQSLNIHALLKYFFIVYKKRDITSFIKIDDFEKDNFYGFVINPINFKIIKNGENFKFNSEISLILEKIINFDHLRFDVIINTLFKYMIYNNIRKVLITHKHNLNYKLKPLDFPNLFEIDREINKKQITSIMYYKTKLCQNNRNILLIL